MIVYTPLSMTVSDDVRCDECGAIVADCDSHTSWHKSLREDRAEGFRTAMLAASLERDHYRAALEAIDQAPLGTDTYAMRVIAQQAIVVYDPEYPNNQRTTP